MLSNDIEKNPGDFIHDFFTFCNWNLNSLTKDDFHRVDLLQAFNSNFDYDIISLCETSLNDRSDLSKIKLENYTFIPSYNSNNSMTGGAGLFYKDTLPLKVRNDLCLTKP